MSIITKALEKAERERARGQAAAGGKEPGGASGEKKDLTGPPKRRSSWTAVVVAAVLVVSAAAGAGIFLLTRGSGSDRPVIPPDSADTARVSPAVVKSEPAGTADKDREVPSSPSNPLSFLRGDRKPAGGKAPSPPRLNGIMYAPSSPKAIIDGSIHKTGDQVGDFVIKDILPDKVILNKGKRDIELQVL